MTHNELREQWNPYDLNGKDVKKDFIARCHVGVGAGGFLRFPLPGDKSGRNWLDERLMAGFLEHKLSLQKQQMIEEKQELLKWITKTSIESARKGVLGYDFVRRLEKKLEREIFDSLTSLKEGKTK